MLLVGKETVHLMFAVASGQSCETCQLVSVWHMNLAEVGEVNGRQRVEATSVKA